MISQWPTDANEAQNYVTIGSVRDDVNKLILNIIADRQKNALHLSRRYFELWKSLENYFVAGGKRIRPYLTVLGYQLYGGVEYDKILRVAAAQEMLNQTLLIHDDIIDRDYIRYGVPNVAGQFKHYYLEQRGFSEEQSNHYANAAGLLVGDLCLSETFALINDSGFSSDQKDVVLNFLQEAVFSAAAGELLDSETHKMEIDDSDVLTIVRLKTAVYSVAVPLISGAYLGGAKDVDIKILRQFAEKVGIAYQLADDLLGVFGDVGITGKTNIGDLREGKHTYLAQQTWQMASETQKLELTRLFGKSDLTQDEANELRQIIIDTEARTKTQEFSDEMVKDAIKLLDMLDLPVNSINILRDFCLKITNREK